MNQIDDLLFQSGLIDRVPVGIACVVNLINGGEQGFGIHPGAFAGYLSAPIVDGPFRGLPWLRAVVDTVNAWRAAGFPVLVHCLGGRSRSVLVTAGCLMAVRGLTAAQAMEWVNRKCPEADPNPHFLAGLQEYERWLVSHETATVQRP